MTNDSEWGILLIKQMYCQRLCGNCWWFFLGLFLKEYKGQTFQKFQKQFLPICFPNILLKIKSSIWHPLDRAPYHSVTNYLFRQFRDEWTDRWYLCELLVIIINELVCILRLRTSSSNISWVHMFQKFCEQPSVLLTLLNST